MFSSVLLSAYTTQSQPSLKKLRDRARNILFDDPSPDYASSSRREDETESSRASLSSAASSPNPNTPSSKLSTTVVSANLFHDLVMRQIHGSESNEQEATPKQVSVSSDLRPVVHNHPLSSWTNSFMPEAQAQYGQTAVPVATYNDAQRAPGFPSTSDFFTPPSSSWTIPAEGSASAGMDYGVFMPHLNLNFNADPNTGNSNGGLPMFDSAEFGSGSSLGMNTNPAADGDADWITFMQLSGFSTPRPEAATNVDPDARMNVDWESFGFSWLW